MKLRCLCLFLFVGLLAFNLPTGEAVDKFLYQQILQMSLLPRGNELENLKIKQATIELQHVFYNAARGVPYPIGAVTGLFNVGRRKRFSGFGSNFGSSFGSDWGSSNRYDPWSVFSGGFYGSNNNHYNNNNNNNNYHPNTNTNSHHQPSYGGGNTFKFGGARQIIHCPSQANQSAVYDLNSTSVAYPATDVGNEFFARSLPGSDLFFQCAIRRAILPGQPPVVETDQNFVTANSTCRSTPDLTLFSYTTQNTAIGGRCWVVQGFQEPVLFSVCLQKDCTNCKLKPTQSNKSYGHPQTNNHGSRNITVNQCVAEYRTVQVLSYCENLPVNQRIIYDRIIVPLFCSCKSIDCMTSSAARW